MRAALVPETPPPRITTLAAGTPGTPPSRMPMPPCSFSKQWAPTWTAMRPATSLIGASSGRPPVLSVDGLVGDRHRAGAQQRLGQRRDRPRGGDR